MEPSCSRYEASKRGRDVLLELLDVRVLALAVQLVRGIGTACALLGGYMLRSSWDSRGCVCLGLLLARAL